MNRQVQGIKKAASAPVVWGAVAAFCFEERRGGQAFDNFSSSTIGACSTSSFNPLLKLRRPLPTWGSLPAPKTRKTSTRIINISWVPSPNMRDRTGSRTVRGRVLNYNKSASQTCHCLVVVMQVTLAIGGHEDKWWMLNGVDDQKAVVEIFFQKGSDFLPLQTAAPATGAGHYHA